jgi:hypothetical protein
VAGFPGLGLLRRLRPTQAPTVDSGPARHRPGRPAGRAAPGRFPRSCCDRLTGEVASCAPAASPRVRRRPSPWPPGRRYRPASESPSDAGVRRRPAQIHQVGAGSSLEGLYSAGSSRPPSRLACRTRVVWQCRPVPSLSGLLPPSPALPGSGCPQLHQPPATGWRQGPCIPARSPHASWRTITVKNDASCSRRPDTATRSIARAIPASV